MGEDAVYVSRIEIEKVQGPLRRAFLPAEKQPVPFGVHAEIAEHYGADPSKIEPHAATLDYFVAATGGWLTGTLAGALAARGIRTGKGNPTAEVWGDVVNDNGVLRVARIHVKYHLGIKSSQVEEAERVHASHADFCPMARTVRNCVEISTELEIDAA